ncbi:MAG: hypothetical protein WCR30_03730 [Clostridia bacterium]
MEHLVYCNDKEKVLPKILSGEKTMIIRGAGGRKIPHGRVFKEEALYFIEKGTRIIKAKAKVISVQNFTGLTEEQAKEIIEKNQNKLCLTLAQIERWTKKCLCLIEFDSLETIEPLEFEHQSNMDDWLILESIFDVVKGSSKKYTYENARFKK